MAYPRRKRWQTAWRPRLTRESSWSASGHPGGQPAWKAEVTFRGHHPSGYGPSADPGETCTAWDLTYTLTQSGGQDFIVKVRGTTTPC